MKITIFLHFLNWMYECISFENFVYSCRDQQFAIGLVGFHAKPI